MHASSTIARSTDESHRAADARAFGDTCAPGPAAARVPSRSSPNPAFGHRLGDTRVHVAGPSIQRCATCGCGQEASWAPYRPPDASAAPGHTAGNDYQGPYGPVTRAANPAALNGNRFLGGLVSYGCYCGPGGDASGSRCGAGAPAVDEIDEQCRQHDLNYAARGVDSGDRPGTHNMFSDWEGWTRARDADQQLADSARRAVDANPGGFSPSARLYAQGIQGIFGGRAAIAGAGQWAGDRWNDVRSGIGGAASGAGDFLSSRASEVESGVTGAARDARSWLGSTADQAQADISSAAGGARSWLGSRASEAEAGVGGFIDRASQWRSPGEALSGIGTGISDAAGWLGSTASQAGSGLLSGARGAGNWLADRGSEAWSGISSTAGRAGNWLANTAGTAVSGVGGALGRAGSWIYNTTSSAISGVANAASGVAGWAGRTGSVLRDLLF